MAVERVMLLGILPATSTGIPAAPPLGRYPFPSGLAVPVRQKFPLRSTAVPNLFTLEN
jgi:hypothetical protein